MNQVARVVSTLISIEILLILARILISWFPGINPWHPVVRFLRAVVDPVLAPFRRILPTFGGIDFSPLLAIIVLSWISHLVSDIGLSGFDLGQEIGFAIAQIVLTVIVVFTVVVLLRVIISIFQADPWHPLVQAIRQMSNPLVRPFAAVVPRSRSVDMAAVAAFVAYLVLYFVAREILGAFIRSL